MAWPAVIAAAAAAAPVVGSLISGAMGNASANRDRKLKRRELEELEKNGGFSRLLKLSQAGRDAQGDMASGKRLLSLRNTGSVP